VPVVPSSIQPIQNEEIAEGGNVTLFCNASGIPPPTVSWVKVKDGQRLIGSKLVFTNINRRETGEYRCEARNDGGSAAETVVIDVQCKLMY